jgi:hypothetical protein
LKLRPAASLAPDVVADVPALAACGRLQTTDQKDESKTRK